MRAVLVFGVLLALVGCGDGGSKKDAESGISVDRKVCTGDTVVIGETVRPIRTADLLSGASASASKVLNEKATKVMGETHYHKIDGSERVFVGCTKGEYSYVTIVEPEWLKGISGWVETKQLREKNNPQDKYEGLIAEWVLQDYVDEAIVGSDASAPDYGRFRDSKREINQQKIDAAKRAIDSGKCERVDSVLFVRRESVVSNYKFIVDCDKGKRLELSSRDLLSTAAPKTNTEKSIGQVDATSRCKAMVLEHAVNKSSVSFKDVLGVSYHRAETTGNVRLTLDFDASDSAGREQSYRAVCIFDPDWIGEVTISTK